MSTERIHSPTYITRLPRLRAEAREQRDGNDGDEADDDDDFAVGLVDVAEALRRRRGGRICRGRLGQIGRGAGAGLNGVRWLKYQRTSKEGNKPFYPYFCGHTHHDKRGIREPPTLLGILAVFQERGRRWRR